MHYAFVTCSYIHTDPDPRSKFQDPLSCSLWAPRLLLLSLRVGQNHISYIHIYKVQIQYVRQGNHRVYGHTAISGAYMYTVLANPTYSS
jgi:hypothetical protein